MDLNLFTSFVAVAEEHSFSRAARVLHTPQPTLSRQIARMETVLGVRLFERCGRHVDCTASGQLLLPLAQAVVARANEAVSLVREQAGGGPTTVQFGSSGGVFALLLAPLLASFAAAYPQVTVSLVEKDDAPLEEAVMSGELQCAVITPWGPARTASQYLLTEELLLVVPQGHRLANGSAVTLDALARESVLLPPNTVNVGNIVADAFRRARIEPVFSYRSTYPELTKALVRKGMGVATMPKSLLAPETLQGLVAIPFEKPLARDLALIYPRERQLPAAARTLMAHIKADTSELRRPAH
jgi:DNA-binding transcriptional LysR family regulator